MQIKMRKKKKSPTCNTHMGKKKVYVKTVILIIFFKYYELFIPYLQPRFKSRVREGGANRNARSCWVMLVDSVLQTRHSSTLNANLLSSSNCYYYFSLKKKVPRVHKGRVIVEAKVDEEEEIRRRRRRTHYEVKCKYKL